MKIQKENPQAVMTVAPSDHWIEDEEEFISNLEKSFKACSENDILMTLGIQPTFPNTGYGYIKYEKEDTDIKKVAQFTEKPSYETAKAFVEHARRCHGFNLTTSQNALTKKSIESTGFGDTR